MSKEISHYEVAVEALNQAVNVTEYSGTVDDVLANADKIKAWLIANADLVPIPAEESNKFLYFGDEERHGASALFPDSTYWYRYDPNSDIMTYVRMPGGDRKFSSLEFGDLSELESEYGLFPAKLSEVPGWAL